jgi:hypothetical protein
MSKTNATCKQSLQVQTYACEGPLPVHDKIKASDEHEAARIFRERHGFRPMYVGDRETVGSCEVCGLTLFDGDNYAEDDEGVMWCEDDASCAKRSGGTR